MVIGCECPRMKIVSFSYGVRDTATYSVFRQTEIKWVDRDRGQLWFPWRKMKTRFWNGDEFPPSRESTGLFKTLLYCFICLFLSKCSTL